MMTTAALLSGCGKYLGDQRFERVQLVATKPADRMTPKNREGGYERYLEVEFSSEANLARTAAHAAIYVEADRCPMRGRHKISALGLFSDGKEVAEPPGETIEVLPRRTDGRRVYVVRPAPPLVLSPHASDGRYHYATYLLPSHPMPGVHYSQRNLERPPYDLASERQDICLRLFAPGYNLTPSRSGTVVVTAEALAAAFVRGVG